MLLLSAVPAALAEEVAPSPRGPALQGLLEAKADSSVTLSSPREEVTVSVNTDTRYRAPGVEQATLADLDVGDTVVALGHRVESGEWLALMVAVLPPTPVGTLKGLGKGIESQVLTVSTHQGERALLTDENSHFRVPDLEWHSLADIEIGDRILALVRPREKSAGHPGHHADRTGPKRTHFQSARTSKRGSVFLGHRTRLLLTSRLVTRFWLSASLQRAETCLRAGSSFGQRPHTRG